MSKLFAARIGLAACSFLVLSLAAPRPLPAQPPAAGGPAPAGEAPADEELAAEIEKERKTAERFLSLLERNPREGTSLDKAYGFFVEQGKLDGLVAGYRDRVAKNDADGPAWMILGLIEARRGNDAKAIEALAKASEHRPADPMAAYYLGRAYAVAGRVDQAIAAFEQAVARKPARADLPPIFSELGRLHQRAGRTEDAAKVWDRLEAAFPNDLRVKAEIAAILDEEGQSELALARYDVLAKSADDEYRKVTYALKAAGLKAKLGKRDEAIADFERLLAGLNPDNWLYREVRRGIENVYLRTDDEDGLVAYYEAWVKKNAEDVAAMTRLAELLDDLGRADDARGWFDKAAKLAPSDARLRRAYIDALRRAGKTADAVAQFEALDKTSPNDPDLLRDWGTVHLEDKSAPEADRKAKAADVWNRLPAARPNDPVVTAQVADWFRQAEMPEQALALYVKAVEQAPDDARYLEYLGEYRHQLGKKDEAVATWRKLAEGKNRNARNLVRLAEVLSGFGYKDEAVAAFREADGMDLEFADRIRFAGLLRDEEQYDAALEQIAKATPLAESDEERQNALTERIETDQAANRLEARIEELRKRSAETPSAEVSLTLARYLDATRDPAGAVDAATDAVKRAPRSVAAHATLARLADAAGRLTEAADAYRRLAALDRRGRVEYLKQVAGLEQRLGRADAALAAARDVLASAPGSPDAYSFYADLCIRLGRGEEGLDALRRAARLAPGDTGPTLALAAALAGQFRTDEATELYWQAFDKSEGFEDKAAVVARLGELYLRTNRIPDLVKRLERAEAGEDREAKLLVAEAHLAASDPGRAVETLKSLLAENPRDTRLLAKLSQLAERDRDFESALRYQKEVVALSPDDKAEKSRLAQLYLASDTDAVGTEFWDRLVDDGLDPVETLSLIDALLGAEKSADAERVVDRRLRDAPEDWELLYRKAFAQLKQAGKKDAAADTFRRLLALDVEDDAESVRAAAARKKAASSRPAPTSPFASTSLPKIFQRTQSAGEIQVALGLRSRDDRFGVSVSGASRRTLAWTPTDYGGARLAALGWLGHHAAKADGTALNDYAKTLREAADAENAPLRASWDWYYLLSFGGRKWTEDPDARDTTLKRLAEAGGTEGAWVYLWSLVESGQFGRAAAVKPLSADELDLVLRSFEKVRREKAGYYGGYIAQVVARQLALAGRKEEAKAIVGEMLAGTDDANELQIALQVAAAAEDFDTVNVVLDRFESLPPEKATAASGGYDAGVRMMRSLWDADKRDQAMRLFDRQLALSRRRLEVPKRPGASGSASQNRNMGRFGLSIYKKGGQQDHVVVDGSEMNDYIGMAEFTLLRNAYEFHNEAKDVDAFVAHLSEGAEGATGPKAAFAHLALAAVRGWQGNKAAVLAETKAALDAAPEDFVLRLTLARQFTAQNRRDEALALLDAVEPLDPNQLRDRELLALDLAAGTSKVDRAKAAASRLFGMRIDAQQGIRLANVMEQVGMTEQAAAVLARLRSQGGGTASTKIELLRHYKSKGENAVAVEIAREIIRAAKSSSGTSGGGGMVRTPDDGHREEAVRVLKEAGELDGLIADARRQAERAPNSVEAQRQLADYLAAVGRADEAVAILKTSAAKRPNDAGLTYELANRMAGMGRTGDAVDLYVAAIKADPDLLGRNFYQMERTFEQANKSGEMFRLIREADLSRGSGLDYAVNTISNKMHDDSAKADAIDTLDALLKKYPDRRAEILPRVNGDEAWNDPRIAAYAFDLVRTEGEKLDWNALGNSSSISGGGQVRALFNNVIRAAKAGATDQFIADVTALTEKHPTWAPGKAILAVIAADRGGHDDARGRLRGLLDDKSVPIPSQAAWSVGLELSRHEPLRDLAIEFVERASESAQNSSNDFNFTPNALLVKLYGDAGRSADARTLLLTRALEFRDPGYSDPRDKAYFEIQNYVGVADKLRELGYPIDALRVYDNYASDPARVQAAQGRSAYPLQQLDKGRQQALAAIDGPSVARFLNAAAAEEKTDKAPALDLVLTLSGSELAAMNVDSAIAAGLAKALAAPAAAPAQGGDPAAEIRTNLAALREKRPDDLSVHVVAAIAAYATGDLDAARAASERAAQLADASPAPAEAPAGPTPPANASLWLLAREAAKHEPTRPLAADLAEKALDAARRSSDTRWAVAMLRERGQQALDAGDKAAAERAWSEALDLIIPRPPKPDAEAADKPDADRTTSSRDSNGSSSSLSFGREEGGKGRSVAHVEPETSFPRSSAGTRSRGMPKGEPRRLVPTQSVGTRRSPLGTLLTVVLISQAPAAETPERAIVNVTQATQALQLADLAAKNGLTELSVRAVRESLASGRPINLAPVADPNVGGIVRTRNDGADVAGIENQIADRLVALDASWHAQGADPVAVYEALAEAVLPAARPTEVFLYAKPLATSEQGTLNNVATESAGRLLVQWTAKSGRHEDLERRLATRPAGGSTGLVVDVVRAMAALERKDREAYKAALAALPAKSQSASNPREAEIVCHAALPALSDPETADHARAALAAVITRFSSSGNEQPFGWLVLRLADHDFAGGRPEEGERWLETYLTGLNEVYSRYSGDYSVYRRRQALQMVARRLASLGRSAAALERLGQALDLPAITQYGGSNENTLLLVRGLAGRLAADTDPAAYERLKAWTLPAPGRNSVRLLSALTPPDSPPAEFGVAPDPAATVFGPGRVPVVTGTAAALLELARRNGTLDSLVAEADRLAGEAVPGAAELAVLAHVAAGSGASASGHLAKVTEAMLLAKGKGKLAVASPELTNYLLVAFAAAGDPALRPAALEICAKLDEVTRGGQYGLHSAGRVIAAECDALDAGVAPAGALRRDDFGPWRVARLSFRGDRGFSKAPAVWVVRNGVARQAAGSGADPLMFRYPLAGSFDVHAETWNADYGEANLAFDGLSYEFLGGRKKAGAFDIGRHGVGTTDFTAAKLDVYNRAVLQVRPGETKVLVNDAEIARDAARTAASPFLGLCSFFGRTSWVRGVRIEGDPTIPREVRLVDGERLDGWNETFFVETKPSRPGVATPRDEVRPDAGGPIWSVAGGVLSARQRPGALFRQSLLAHHRPLFDGDVIEYEFLDAAGNNPVHPSLGRLAFLLTPEGVRLHWAAGEGDNDWAEWSGLAFDNAVEDPDGRRGPERLPLKAGEWNAVRVAVADGVARVELNGELVYERPLGENDDRVFGLFRYNDKPSQVRNVVLRGDWPERLDDATKADLFAAVPASPEPTVTRFERALITEAHLVKKAE